MPNNRKEYAELRKKIKSLRLRVVELQKDKLRHSRMGVSPKSDILYQTLMENIHLGISFIDTDRKIVTTNVGLGRFLRKPRSEIIGKYCFREFEKRNAVCSHCPGTRAMATGRPALAETEGVRDDGSRMAVRIQAFPVFGTDDSIKGFIEVIEDITERRQAAEKLKESEQRFKTVFDNAADGILLADVESKKFHIGNKAICQMLGCKPEEIKNLGVSDIHPKEHLSYIVEQFEKQARKEITVAEDIPVKRKDGSVFYADIGSFPIVLAGKTYLAGIFRDTTEHKKIEEELSVYRDRMVRAERLASLGTLSATLAHELTQPLTVIRLSIENSLEDLEAKSCPKSVIEGLRDGLNEVSNATSVVDRFRNFARQSSRRTFCEINLGAVAGRIIQLLGKTAQRAKMTLRLKGMNKLPAVYSNEKDIEQLFFSLTENAIQAADGKKSHRLTIEGVVKNKNIELRFSDNCSGIAPENLNRIFDPFFTTGSDDGRTGLGLPIVQRILSGYGGKISVRSRPGKGTTFYVTLPIHSKMVK
jgi:PAS domain S-box-containing protein